ncbi:MAG: hypothetical protein GXO83_08865 [Chlorobi bacterium]|nr:hypothetical protein [Chlorobiota bacterium]
MKKFFITAILLYPLLTCVSAQPVLEILHNKISTNIFSMVSRDIGTEGKYHPAIMHGLMYSRDLLQNNFVRVKFNYFQKAVDNTSGDLTDRNVWSDIEMGAGYVQMLGNGNIVKPYVSGDFMITSAIIFTEYGGGFVGSYEKRQLRRTGISFEPALGITFQVSQVLSFAIETNLEIGFSYEKGTDYTWSTVTIPKEEPVHHFIFVRRWNPLPLLSFELSF